jgi:stage II sporulation protein AA (anti-sigma F factor antagonist)
MSGGAVSSGEILRDGSWLLANWRGDIDMANADILEEAALGALQNTDSGLIINLTDVAYVDSAGIRSLLTLRRLLAHRQQKMFVVVPERSVLRKALEVGGVSALVPIHRSIDAVLQQR